jgi:hypothetical protein
VGIGNNNPKTKLDVNGKIKATELCDENGSNCHDISDGWNATTTGINGTMNFGCAHCGYPYDKESIGTIKNGLIINIECQSSDFCVSFSDDGADETPEDLEFYKELTENRLKKINENKKNKKLH